MLNEQVTYHDCPERIAALDDGVGYAAGAPSISYPDPDGPLHDVQQRKRWWINGADEYAMPCTFCPWCGKRLET